MKTRLIWKDCRLNDDKDSFWIECTDNELAEYILPLIKDDDELKEEISFNRGFCKFEGYDQSYCNFLLISFDLVNIKSYTWQMPYSGQWNGSCPFEEFNVIDFNNLVELEAISFKLKALKPNEE